MPETTASKDSALSKDLHSVDLWVWVFLGRNFTTNNLKLVIDLQISQIY